MTSLSFRTYEAESPVHKHPFVQVVLPVQGELEIELEGRGGRLDLVRGVLIAPDISHTQAARGINRFLILECDLPEVHSRAVERIWKQGFVNIPAAARRLIEFVDLSSTGPQVPASLARHCVPLLLDALLDESSRPKSRLETLRIRIESDPGERWSVYDMAQVSRLSVSRLHALFRAELGKTPQEWLSDLRLLRVREGLAESDLAIAQLALDAGYSDQTALTRAMRRATGVTPGAYRKRARQ
jgi:AraC-like DNA-binding protein